MLPAVTAEQALRWRRRVPRWGLSLAVAVPLLVLVVAETVLESTECTAQAPCRLPLDTLAYHLVPVAELLAMGMVALALMLPRAAVWGAALVAALLAGPVAVDSSFPSVWHWALVWFVLLGAADLLARWRQQVEAAAWQAPTQPYPDVAGPVTDPLPRDEDTRLAALVVAALAVVVAGGLLAWHLQATQAQRQREARSTRVDATVVQLSPDGYTVTLDVQGRRVRIEPLGSYAVGDSVPVLVDPTQPTHVALVAEPDDPSWRIGVAALLLVVLLGLAARLWSRGRRRFELLHRGGPGVRLRAGRHGARVLLTTLDDPGFARPLALVRDLAPALVLLPLSALSASGADGEDDESDDDDDLDAHGVEPPDVTTLSDEALAAWADGLVASDPDDDDVPPPPPVPRVLDGGAPATVIGLRRDGDPIVLQLDDAPPLVSSSGVVDPWTWGRLRDGALRLRPRDRGQRPAARPADPTAGSPPRPRTWGRATTTALRLVTPVATPLAYLLALAVYPAARWLFDGDAGWGALLPIAFGGSTVAEGLVLLAGLSRPPLGVRAGALLHRGRWMDELIPLERVRGVTAGSSSVVLRLGDPDDALALPPQAVARFADVLEREPMPEQAAFAVEQLLRTTSPSGRRGWRRPSVALVPGAIAVVGLLMAWAQAHFG
ncbi:MAG: hypothetical protein ACTHLJ_11035 [Angustibacter sp.]